MWPLRLIVLSTCLLASTLAFCQNFDFPVDWLGRWQGELEIFAGPKKVNSVPMALEINIVDSTTITYFIRYGTGEDALRPYHLKVIDASKGRYVMDEHNGIAIETAIIGDRLISLFEVQGSVIQSTAYREGEHIIYEIYAGSFIPISVSGDTIIGTDTIPAVQTFPISSMQRAVLTR